MEITVRDAPCRSCPYRKDCPSGVWHESEYLKLPEYDKETFEQPPGFFLCHDGDRESQLCRGWAEVHGGQAAEHDLLCRRIGRMPDIHNLEPSGVELHGSGREACDVGMKDIDDPSQEAIAMAERISVKHGLEAK